MYHIIIVGIAGVSAQVSSPTSANPNPFRLIFPLAVPPSIEPFAFQEGLAEGMRTRTVCGVSRGDPPLKLIWLKDGDPLPDLLGANVTMLDQYSSLLSIPSLSATHSGEYTCVAKNPAAEIKYTALLQVKGSVLAYPSTQINTRHMKRKAQEYQSHWLSKLSINQITSK